MAEMRLSESRQGQQVKILRLLAGSVTKQRLLDLGFVRGTALKIIRYAPLKDPMEIEIKGSHLSLRVEEAKTVVVEEKETS